MATLACAATNWQCRKVEKHTAYRLQLRAVISLLVPHALSFAVVPPPFRSLSCEGRFPLAVVFLGCFACRKTWSSICIAKRLVSPRSQWRLPAVSTSLAAAKRLRQEVKGCFMTEYLSKAYKWCPRWHLSRDSDIFISIFLRLFSLYCLGKTAKWLTGPGIITMMICSADKRVALSCGLACHYRGNCWQINSRAGRAWGTTTSWIIPIKWRTTLRR